MRVTLPDDIDGNVDGLDTTGNGPNCIAGQRSERRSPPEVKGIYCRKATATVRALVGYNCRRSKEVQDAYKGREHHLKGGGERKLVKVQSIVNWAHTGGVK
ncbi:hypothetical protein Hypma_005473 [Hypsizygus marmoreus]|uniref:Uncharacterized protein n=1 Tax=Hypsizygus marmoreus TaxID=39966 RepID=A0A369J6A9_HYPMA|nr:hypothetical protein Hypma_005473 [Hypsizygus marmoreus]